MRHVSYTILYMKWREILCVLVLCFFIFLASQALFHDGFFRTDDDLTVVRIEYMVKELQRGNWVNNFPVRMSGELSNFYGYPLYLFYSPLTYYMGSILMFLGLSSIVATKYVYVFPLIFGPLVFYFAARQRFPLFSSLIASILFTLYPYRGFDTYLRGSVAEAWAISFIPLIFAGVFLLQKKNMWGGVFIALGLFLVITSHHLAGILALVLLGAYGVIFLRMSKSYWGYVILGVTMSSFYLIPMVVYLKHIRLTYLSVNTTEIFQSLLPFSYVWDMGILKPVSYFSLVFILILIGSLFIIVKSKANEKKEYLFWVLAGVILYLLMFETFEIVWRLLPFLGILQFGWRVQIVLSFIIPFLVAMMIFQTKKMTLRVMIGVAIILASLNFLPSFHPKEYSYFYEYHPEGECATLSHQDEYLPKWVVDCPLLSQVFVTKTASQIAITQNNPVDVKAEITVPQRTDLIINKYYFPGWEVYLNGKRAKVEYLFSEYGVMRTDIGEGKNRVEVIYKKTFIMWVADLITIGGFMVLVVIIIKGIFKKRKVKKKQ